MPVPADPLAALAARQHGLVTRAQALEIGASPGLLDRRLRAGRLLLEDRGLYRVAGAPVTWHGRVLGLCLTTDGMASHRCGSTLLGVGGFGRCRPEVTTARDRHPRRPDAIVHRSRDLGLAGVHLVEGIPVTAPARLAVDAGAVLRERAVEALIQEMVRQRLLTWDDVAVSVMRHSRRGRDGVGVARRIVERRLEGLVGDSPLESMMLAAILDAGLPQPVLQLEVFDAVGFVARVDAAWPDRGVIAEADGRAFHLNEVAFEADRAKRNRLRAAGWIVIEATYRMLMEHRYAFVRALGDALAARPPGSFSSGCTRPSP